MTTTSYGITIRLTFCHSFSAKEGCKSDFLYVQIIDVGVQAYVHMHGAYPIRDIWCFPIKHHGLSNLDLGLGRHVVAVQTFISFTVTIWGKSDYLAVDFCLITIPLRLFTTISSLIWPFFIAFCIVVKEINNLSPGRCGGLVNTSQSGEF